MKKMTDRDYLFIGVLLFILGVVVMTSDPGTGRKVPLDERHDSIYQGIKNGRSIAETQLVCTTCHGASSIPLPHKHPPKEQCLICHQLA